jgi:hypothetical protein
MKELENEKILTIEELVESIKMEAHVNGANLLKISENFPKNGETVHLVRTIEIEEENEIMIFHDCDSVIETNNMVIGGFLKTSILKATKCHTDEVELDSYKLYLNDGNIVIQPIIW